MDGFEAFQAGEVCSSCSTARILGVRVDDIPMSRIVDEICAAIASDQRMLVLNVNAHMAMLARRNLWVQDFLDRGDLVFCDGAGIQLASLILNRRGLHRCTPPEWAETLGRRLALSNRSVFWLGGAPDVVALAAQRFETITGLRTKGFQHGFFDHRLGSTDNRDLLARINQAAPDLLFVNMGMPLQERWLADHWDRLNVKVAVTAGALVDHVAGRVRRPPRWVANCGLEWAARLAIEPRRLWRRYLVGLPRFGAAVLTELVANTIHRTSSDPSRNR